MTTITVNVIRKLSGNYTYTLEDGKVVSRTTPAQPERIRRVSRAQAPAETTPAAAAKITTTPARVQAAAAPDYPKFKAANDDGIPGPKDRFSFVTLEGPIYNGYRLPLPEAGDKLYPVFMVVNQNGALMQTIREGTGEDLGWYLRSSGGDFGPEAAREKIVDDIKALRTWQRRTYAKSKEIPAGEVDIIPVRGTLESFQAAAADIYRALKDYGKKVYITLAGVVIPAHILAAACKLALNEQADCRGVGVSFPVYEKDRWGAKHQTGTETFQALVIRLGRATYTLKNQSIPDGARLIACSI